MIDITGETAPLISVVIPTHNRGDIVDKAVRSAQNQTYKNIEIIIISDGSEDNTDEVVNKLCAEDERIRYFSYHPGKGGNVARNTGIKEARGEYVAFLDDDDEWHDEKLAKQLDVFASDDEIGLVCTGINGVRTNSSAKTIFIPPAVRDSSKLILLRNCIGSTTTVMVKKELFDECGCFDENLRALQDYDLWIRLCQKTRVGVVREPCVEYLNDPAGEQISKYTDKYIEAISYIDNKYQELISQLSKKNLAIRKNVFILLIAKKGIRNGQRGLAIKYTFKAMKYKLNKDSVMCLAACVSPTKLIEAVKFAVRRRNYSSQK